MHWDNYVAGERAAQCLLSVFGGILLGLLYIFVHDIYCLNAGCEVEILTHKLLSTYIQSQGVSVGP